MLQIMNWTFAIGDVHGCADRLIRLLADIDNMVLRYSEKVTSSKIVFLGDYVDRGPDSSGVVDLVRDRVEKHGAVAVKGNHDLMMADALLRKIGIDLWVGNGAVQTFQSYGIDLRKQEDVDRIASDEKLNADAKWLDSLPLFHEDALRFFVHAGIDPKRSLADQSEDDMLWIRRPFHDHPDRFEKHIVHGHTPHSGDPENWNGARTNLDTGAVFGGKLTAARFDDETAGPALYITA